ncbi:MAG: prolipoprotein diacylglyceryl transferase [Ignavibacteriales bacterium]|nr:prolipoprotein diacylglyceryl transferase [Ignavibacteriales bacterium]
MIPELFKIGPFTLYSYGLMLALSFIISGYILTREFKRVKLSENFASELTLIAMLCGVAGSKIFYLFEDWDNFLQAPLQVLFSPGGLTYYGGFILATIGIAFYVRKKKLGFLRVADLMSPSLAIAYGIGRIGCHLAGDGDYGIPTNLPWAVNYEKGIVPPSLMFRGSDIAAQFPNGIVPDNTPLHPTPMYEFFIAVIIFALLWKFRIKNTVHGRVFFLYLALSAVARFSVEFLRLNPGFMFGMTQAQFISVILFFVGLAGLYKLHPRTVK